MATRKLETISPEEFDRRLDASNEGLRRELADAQERVEQLGALIVRKEAFARRLEQVLAEIEREAGEAKGVISNRRVLDNPS